MPFDSGEPLGTEADKRMEQLARLGHGPDA
jgi:hypothetical protein